MSLGPSYDKARRAELDKEIEVFLSSGGTIQVIPNGHGHEERRRREQEARLLNHNSRMGAKARKERMTKLLAEPA